MKYFALAAVASLGLAACATSGKVIPLEDASILSNNALALSSVQEEKAPNFIPTVPERAGFGALGAIGDLAVGSTFVSKHGLSNPADEIEGIVRSELAAQFGQNNEADPYVRVKGDKAKDFYDQPNSLIVNAATTSWGYIYFPFNWNRYRVQYVGVVDLIDGSTAERLASSQCVLESHDSPEGAPTKNEMLDNEAVVLKSILSDLAKQCADKFLVEALSLEASAETAATEDSDTVSAE